MSLAYHGGNFNGWQRQPNDPSVQAELERVLSTILRQPIEVTGCGRTDAGVHARAYIAHFDTERPCPDTILNGLNSLLPAGIAVYEIWSVADTAHARFDARERAYEYHITSRKPPFAQGLVWFYPQAPRLDLAAMQSVADLLPQFEAFFPFCKTHSGVDHYRCDVREARWQYLPEHHRWVFHISANRFLRGMVRLIVGASVQAGMGQLDVEQVRHALATQTPLPKSLSVPADGLFLTRVDYGGIYAKK